MKKIMLLAVLGSCFGWMSSQELTKPFENNRGANSITFTTEFIATTGTNRAVVDMNGDFLDDIVSITSTNVNIQQQLSVGGFNEVNIGTSVADNSPSWSLAAADFDGNGYTDLLYGGGSGVTFMKANDDGTAFTEISGPEYVFSQRSNFVDINNDGHLDAFVCHDVAPNVYYINDGSGNLTFNQGGLGDYPSGGNYGSIWIDYDNDGDIDLFIAKCGGEPARRQNQMHRNNGDGTFTEVAEDIGLGDIMQTWSSAWGDFDNDGDMDVFVGGSSDPHKLMENNGDNTFTDVTVASGVDALLATGIENTAYDFDNDGNLDIASNGNILYGNGDNTFTEITLGVVSQGAFGDLNNDGFIDAFNAGTIYWNDANSNNWVKIITRGVESNLNGIAARVMIETPSGSQIRDVRSGEGFGYMSSLNTHFGIGSDTEINSITVVWPSGIIDVLEDPNINEAIVITEGETLGIEESLVNNMILYPNPTADLINLNATYEIEGATYAIFDSNGKKILQSILMSNIIDVSELSSGSYILRISHNSNNISQKFIKR